MKSETSFCACRCEFAIGTIINNNLCYSAENTSRVYAWYVGNISWPRREWAIKPKLYNCREFRASERARSNESLTSAQNTFSLIIILHINEMVAFWFANEIYEHRFIWGVRTFNSFFLLLRVFGVLFRSIHATHIHMSLSSLANATYEGNNLQSRW